MAFGLFNKKKKQVEVKGGIKHYQLKVKDVIREAPDAISIVFENPEAPLSYKPGQFVTIISNINGQSVRRAYSLCSTPGIDPDPAVTVKRVDGGIMSNYLNKELSPGDILEVMEPMGNFQLHDEEKSGKKVLLVGGGSGITPLFSMIKRVLNSDPDADVRLIYANRNYESIIFRNALKELQGTHASRFQITHVLDEPPADWDGQQGVMTPVVADLVIGELESDFLDSAHIYLCGPGPMMQNLESVLAQRGIDENKIHRESFVAENNKAVPVTDNVTLETRDVKINFEGDVHTVTVKPDTSILETALDQGIDLPYSCQSGLCTACRCRLLNGQIKMDEDEGLSDQEIKDGYVLICVGHPLTDDVEITYD